MYGILHGRPTVVSHMVVKQRVSHFSESTTETGATTRLRATSPSQPMRREATVYLDQQEGKQTYRHVMRNGASTYLGSAD